MMSLKSDKFLKLISILFTTAIALAFGLLSHISASEFWPISLSKEVFFHGEHIDSGLFLKPTFHLLLGFIYFIPLDNWDHILTARTFFSLMGVASIFLFLAWVKKVLSSSVENANRIVWALVLLLSPVLIEQIVKVRSDMLSLFFSLLVLYIACRTPPPYSRKIYFTLLFLNLALYGCTPRAVFHEMVVISFLLPFYWPQLKAHKQALNQYLVIFGMPLIFLIVAFLKFGLASPLVNIYLAQSFSSGFWDFGFLKIWFLSEPVGSSLLLIGLALAAFRVLSRKSDRIEVSFLMAAIVAGLSILLADLKTPFLIGSFYLFLLAPLARSFCAYRIQSRKLPIFLAITFVISAFAVLPYRRGVLFEQNIYQKDIIQKLSAFLEKHPTYKYFDGLGLLPRSNQLMAYLGPGDALSLETAMQKLQYAKPEVILYTARTTLLIPEIDELMRAEYQLRDKNLYLRNDLPLAEGKIDFDSAPVVNFNL